MTAAHPNSPTRTDRPRLFTDADAYRYGENLLYDEGEDYENPRRVVWRCLQFAAEVELALPADGPRRQTQHGTEYHHTSKEIADTEWWMGWDKITYPPKLTRRATIEEIAYHDVIMLWPRHIRSHRKTERLKLIWALANGLPVQKAADMRLAGMYTKDAVEAAKYRAINDIIKKLRFDG